MRRSLLAAVVGLGTAIAILLAAAVSSRGRQRASVSRNLLLVTLDTVRADRIGAYGFAAAETPALDRLAREGVRFERAYSAVPLTLPSHATLLSGLLPPRHGLRNNGAGEFPRDRETLATTLSEAGYRTGAFTGAFVLDRRFGLARGFENFDDEIPRDPAAPAGLEAERPGSVVVDRALEWLAREDPRPFFAWVHLYDPHAPYTPPEPFRSRHPDDPYQGEIAGTDAQVGRLLEMLDRRSLASSTIVAVLADHGEALGEHGELTHGLLLYEPTLRVPFLLRAPSLLEPGRVVETPVGLADVAPTLAALLEKPLAPAREGSGPSSVTLDGRDIAPALRRGEEPSPGDLYAESEYPRIFGWSGLASLRRRHMKYISAPRPELYDIVRDPGESVNLFDPSQGRSDLDQKLSLLRKEARAPAPLPAGSADETIARLASLGYIGGVPPSTEPSKEDRARKDPKEMVSAFRAFEEANWEVQAGRFGAAVAMLEPLVPVDPENAVFRGLLAQAHRGLKNFPRAVRLYREAVAASPADSEARYNLAVTLQEAGRPAEALVAIVESIQRDPRRPEAHSVLGIALAAAGKPAAALAEFDLAVRLDPRNPAAHNNRGNVLRPLGRLSEAEAAYRRAIALAPAYAEPWNGLGALEVERSNPAAALPFFEKALALAPAYHEARLNRGIALETLGDTRQAVDAYRDFLDAAGNDPAFAAQRQVARQLIARLTRQPKTKTLEGG